MDKSQVEHYNDPAHNNTTHINANKKLNENIHNKNIVKFDPQIEAKFDVKSNNKEINEKFDTQTDTNIDNNKNNVKFTQQTEAKYDASYDTQGQKLEKISKYRKALPQFLATSAMYLNLVNMGIALGFPTIMLPAVQNGHESVVFSQNETSWFASLMFIFQPAGSLVSSFLINFLGRRNSLLLINVPFFIIWVLIYWTNSIPLLMMGSIIIALNIGFLETPAMNYVGEISTPKLRGILTSYSAPCIYLGIIVEFILGKIYHWRTVALINSTIPLITIAAMFQIPESPMWLLSKSNYEKSKKSLCWLRGWVSYSYVQEEYEFLLNYKNESSGNNTNVNIIHTNTNESKIYNIEKTNGSFIGINNSINGNNMNELNKFHTDSNTTNITTNYNYDTNSNTHNDTSNVKKYKQEFIDKDNGDQYKTSFKNIKFYDLNLIEHKTFNTNNNNNINIKQTTSNKSRLSLKLIWSPEYRKPFILVTMYFLFYYMSGISSIRPFLMLVIKEMNIPIDPKICAIFVPSTGFFGAIVSMCVIKRTGKRPLSLISISGSAFCAITCGILTYRPHTEPQLLPFIILLGLAFFTSVGIAAIPWMLISEVFPLRGRGIASGLVAMLAYIFAFATAKTFLDLYSALGLHGVFFLYGSCSVFGIIYFYLFLPETEGKTLHEIELHFKEKKSKKTSMGIV